MGPLRARHHLLKRPTPSPSLKGRGFRVASAFVTLLLFAGAAPARAQSIDDEARALEQAKHQAAVATARASALEQQAADAARDADRARAAQAAVAARVQAAEADIAAARARIGIIERLRGAQRVRLAAKQQPIVRLAAALQVMARRPPALALVQPGSLVDLVHVRALLASSLPLVRARTADLRAEVAEGDRLRARAAQALASLRSGEQQLQTQRTQLARLEAGHRARSAGFIDSARAEQLRALALGEEARDIADQMQELGLQADVRGRLARLRPPLPRPEFDWLPRAVAPRAEAPGGGYRLPVAGRPVTGLGEVSPTGVRARGLTVAAGDGADVIAPSAGRIAFAAPFRSYGMIVILDHGDGWTTTVTNLSAIGVAVGDRIEAGGVLGRAGAGTPEVTVELRHHGRPVDIPPLLAAG